MSRRPPILALLLGLTLLAFVVERLVVTDLEALEAWAERATAALQASDMEAFDDLITEDFTYGRMDREAALRFAESASRQVSESGIQIVLRKIEIDGDTAEATAQIFGTAIGRRYRLETPVRLERGDDGWRLAHADAVAY